MRTKQEILARLRQELPHLQEVFSVKAIGLFGSYARGDATAKSDIDLVVEFTRPPTFARFMELEELLRRTLGVKVDLVPADALKEYVQPRILSETIYA
jgi:predicted nucleotidyltransferase